MITMNRLAAPMPTGWAHLSDREMEVLILVSSGLDLREAAQTLHYSYGYVKNIGSWILRDAEALTLPHAVNKAMADQVPDLAVPLGLTRPKEFIKLTPYMQGLLVRTAEGERSPQIATALDVKPSTVRTGLCRMQAALGAGTLSQAVRLGWQLEFLGH